jgi:hypothetical protein
MPLTLAELEERLAVVRKDMEQIRVTAERTLSAHQGAAQVLEELIAVEKRKGKTKR